MSDGALRFWLRYVEARGGLTDDAGDSAIAVLPSGLQALHRLPEELVLTSDPDVAREDGAMFLAAGHPVLGQAADDVLAHGDVGRLAVPVPATLPPETSALLERAREQFPVDHGRIDATGAPTKGVRSVLRVGALVSYTLSAEDHYQERAECWVDVTSRSELPEQASAKLAALPALPADGPANLDQLTPAIGQAHRIISAGAERRQSGLSGQVAKAFDAELERAGAYYRDVLATIARRRENAPADRIELLNALAEATREERARRLAEIREKFQPAHEIRPYRLHVLDLPVWRLPVDVRRGDRRYPLTLDWLLPLSRFADIRCPHCDATGPLVAGKTRLGCDGCLAKPAVQLVADPPAPKRKPTRPPETAVERPVQRAGKPRAAGPARVSSPAAPRLSPAKIVKAGDKLYRKLWDAVVSRDRRASRMCAPDSPAAAAMRLYGPAGPAMAIGIPPAEAPVASASRTTPADPAGLQATRGAVETAAGRQFPFLLWWRMVDGTPLIDEILPFDAARDPARLPHWVLGPGRRELFAPAQPRVPLGPVGELLWQRGVQYHGLPIVLRSFAAWWRLPDEASLTAAHSPTALAAAVERMICQRAARPGGHYAEAASAYRVDVRAAGNDLQGQLQLSRTRLW